MICFDGVTKTFEKVNVLRGVSFTAVAGMTTVLLGTSGCGKSTILRLVMGLLEPDVGTVTFAGGRVDGDSILTIRRRTGYVLQEGGLFPHLTGRQNVTLVARHLKWEPKVIEARLEELIDLVALKKGLLDRYPMELSGGQRQRLSLMRALMLNPEVLLMDEPLGALDPITRSDLQRELRAIFRRLQKTVLFVTHDLAEGALLGDRVILMNEGQIVQEGAFEDLVERPQHPFVSRFVGAQPIDWRSIRENHR